MKFLFLSRTKSTRRNLFRFFPIIALFVSLAFGWQINRAQQAQLSLADVLIGLRSKKVTLAERNKLLSDAVKVRGITFSMTPEIEFELENTGADDELVDAIRQKSIKILVAANIKPTPAPTPVSTPIPIPVATPIATPTPAPTPDFAFYRNRADENNFKGDYDVAVNDYNEAIKLNPKDTLSYLNRARAFSNKKNYDSAIADYDKAIELDPKDAMSYFNRADSYERKGDTKQALGDYQKAVDLDANNESAKNNLKRLQAAEQSKIVQPETKKTETVTAVTEPPKEVESSNTPNSIEFGQLNSLAVKMIMPAYPEVARKLNVQGTVNVQIALDETGKVISAKATNGNSLLRHTSEEAARNTQFKPATVGNRAVKATGFIVYNFVNQ